MSDPTEQLLRRGLEELVRDRPALGPGRPHRPTTRWLAGAAALVLVAGIGLAGWFGLSQGEGVNTAEPQQGPVQVMGVRWLATQIYDKPVRPEATGAVPYLVFEDTQRVNGGNPCNKLFGSYRIDGDQLRLGPLGITQMSCGSSDRKQQSAYSSALGATTTVRRDGRTLTLLDSTGAVVLVFRAAASASSPIPSKTLIRVHNDATVRFARSGAATRGRVTRPSSRRVMPPAQPTPDRYGASAPRTPAAS